jgi:hypothetical protein
MGADRADLLRRSGGPLAARLGSPEPARRIAAARVMGRLFHIRPGDAAIPETVGDQVIIALNDGDQAVRGAAMAALGEMRYERALQALTQLFEFYGRGPLAALALDALARLGHPSSVDLFVSQLTVGTTAMRVSAIEGLARAGGATNLSPIQRALENDRNETVGLAGDFAAVLLSRAPLDPIVASLTRSRLHDQAMRYLMELVPGRGQLLALHLQNPSSQVKADIADVLGFSGDVTLVSAMEALKAGSDPEVIFAGQRAALRLTRGSR